MENSQNNAGQNDQASAGSGAAGANDAQTENAKAPKATAKQEKLLDAFAKDGKIVVEKGQEQTFADLIAADSRFDKHIWNFYYDDPAGVRIQGSAQPEEKKEEKE